MKWYSSGNYVTHALPKAASDLFGMISTNAVHEASQHRARSFHDAGDLTLELIHAGKRSSKVEAFILETPEFMRNEHNV
jgi:hypothetical protein